MTFKTWLLFLVMETALSLSPGPAVFYVVSQGARGALRRSLPAAAGIISANAVYFTLSATSLGAIIAASGRFFTIAKWVGAAYLIYLGVKALLSARSSHAVALGGNLPEEQGDRRRVYLGALTLQLANPKALLFFLALLPQFIDPSRPVVPQMLILAATSMLPEFCILLGYGWLAHRALRASAKFGMSGGMNRWLAWIEGAGLLGCATLVLKFNRAACVAAIAVGCALLSTTAAVAAPAAGDAPAPVPPRLVHRFLEVEVSPDAALVASVEGDSPAGGFYPPIRDLVIRRVRDGAATKIAECPAPQTQEFWHALKDLNVPTSIMIYPGEGHGLRDPAHSADAMRRTLEWFDRYLK